MKFNKFETIIDARATRSLDAKITMGFLAVEFSRGKIKLCIDPNDRNQNRELLTQIEETIHKYIGEKVDQPTLNRLAAELEPLAKQMKTIV